MPFKGMELLFIGFAAGFAHVVSGADHLTALAPFAARREQQAAWQLGLHWGLGHAGGVALIALLVWLLKDTAAAEWLSSRAEWLVGAVLVAVGALGIHSLLRQRIHSHEHDHFGIRHAHIHSHFGQADSSASHHHSHAALGIGLLHGAAGGTHLWVLLPTLAIASFGGLAIYLTAYALATVAAMTLFSAGLGRLAKRLASSSPQLGHGFALACCTASLLVGSYWLLAG